MKISVAFVLAGLTLFRQSIPQLRLTEELRIGDTLDGQVTFTRVASIVPGPDEGFYVLDSKDTSLRLFDRTGHLVRVIGRDGAGPGEYRALTGAGLFVDTLWVVDPELRRLSLFRPSGEFVRSINIPAFQGHRPIVRGFDAEKFLFETETYVSRETNYGSDLAVVRTDHAAQRSDTLAVLHFGTGNWLFRSPPPTPYAVMIPNPFNDGSLFDADSRGRYLTVVHRLATARHTYEVIRLDSVGKRLWAKTFPYQARPITNAMKDSVAQPQIRSAAKFPAHMPAVSRLVVGEDGTVWLRREELGREGNVEWNVLGADGRLIGVLQAPTRLQMHMATRTHVLAALENQDGVPVVIRYRITPAR